MFDAEPFIAKMIRTLKETGYTVLTVEYDTNHRMVTKTYPVDEIQYLRGSCSFLYAGEEVFYWSSQKNYRIYEGEVAGLDFTVERLPTKATKEQLQKVVDHVYNEYGWGYNYFGTGADIDNFADEYYFDDKTRALLHLVVLEKKQENYFKRYGEINEYFDERIKMLGDEIYDD